MRTETEPGDRTAGQGPGDVEASLHRRSVALLVGARQALDRLPPAWRRALVAIVVLRLALAVAAFTFGGLLQGLPDVDVDPVFGSGFSGWRGHSPEDEGMGLLGAGLERFDALWYLAIAEDGYPAATADEVPSAAAFFPGFPLVVGVLGRLLVGHYYLAASLVGLASAVAALAGVHRLVEEETADPDLARRALMTVAVFPSAFFLVAPYSEGLFLATSAWALVWARRGGWARAGWLAGAAALTRNVGVLLVLPLLLEAWRQRREGRHTGPAVWFAAVAGAPLGLMLFAGFGWLRFGTPLGTVEAQTGWEREWSLPTASLGDAWRFAIDTPGLYPSGYHTMDLIIFAAVGGAVVWLLRRAPLPYSAYAAAHVLAWLVYPFPGRPLMSVYRFALGVAPLAWAFGAWTRRRGVATVWDGCSAALTRNVGVLLVL
ncbi:MAG TPA: hypothetical protein VHF25_04580, partial [Nitriliruptorales bacterium]|nr:hypothetical protein [Nitriliruptorales bacterium]